ncbi:MAG TPA: MraY family glycosyltransferase [Candidatus Babeliales bacterium]|nr:MraY family glycosyltransferase [Candidatus Babeliales bacterium]
MALTLVGVLAFMITCGLVPSCIWLAQRWRLIDAPDGQLKQHAQPTPYLGGLAVYGGLWGATALYHNLGSHGPGAAALLLPLYWSTTGLLLLGLWDDRYVLTPRAKLLGQMVCVGVFLGANWCLGLTLPLVGWAGHLLLGAYLVTVINAFNLIDIMDGLAGTVTLGSASVLLYWSSTQTAPLVSLLLVALIGAVGGFLVYNAPPARLYLGDSGSLLLGGYLAAVACYIPWQNLGPGGLIWPVIAFALPLLELVGLILIRWYKRQPIYLGSPDHFALYLRAKGWSNWQVLGLVGGFSSILFGVSWLFQAQLLGWWGVGLSAAGFLVSWYYLIYPPK